MANDEMKKCAHEACSCIAGENDYCSQYCEDAAETTEISCNCGHGGCSLEDGVTTSAATGGQTPLYR